MVRISKANSINKKASINLAMSTIVMVIIGMVMLTAGILLMKTFITGAEEIKDQLDAQTESELERLLLDQGAKVALPLHTVTMEAGEDHIFGVGILNIDSTLYNDEFSLELTFSKLIDENSLEVEGANDIEILSWLLYNTETMIIEENEHKSEAIYVGVPEDATKGTYIYNVYVYYDDDDTGKTKYDSVKKLYVAVE
ncbi:hypothetical protein CL619_05105 [archaeon]|nr:hypothetical protein [archaeon]